MENPTEQGTAAGDPAPRSPAPARTRWGIGLALTGLVLAGGVAWWLLGGGGSETPSGSLNQETSPPNGNQKVVPPPPPDDPDAQELTEALAALGPSEDMFEDVTSRSGLHFTNRNGEEAGLYSMLERLGGGLALIDYDGDGLLDIFVVGGGYFDPKDNRVIKGYPCKLYKNLGGFRFQDVTHEAGLDRIPFYTTGVAVGDYNRDGRPDLLVTGWGGVLLFRNNGNGTFTDVTKEAGLDLSKGRDIHNLTKGANLDNWIWVNGAAWVDLKGDGYPDLYLARYANWSPDHNPLCPSNARGVKQEICTPKRFEGVPHLLFRNNGDGTFTDVSREAGLNVLGKKDAEGKQVELGRGLGVVATDFSNKGRPDVYVANDAVDNFLFMNRTRRGFFGHPIRLEEIGFRAEVARDGYGHANASMGVDAGDYDRSGFASIFVTNYQDEMHGLYQNLGREQFTFATAKTGISAIGQHYVGWGTCFVDLLNRGWEDLVITNGHVYLHPVGSPFRQKPVLFLNLEGRHFEAITERGGPYFRTGHQGRGLAVGDLDNDGRPDLVICHLNEPVVVLRNAAGDRGPRNHWLGIELEGRAHRDLAGTRIVVEVKGTRRTRFALGGGSYLSACDPRHLFGLGRETAVDRVTVYWSWGKTQTWDGKLFPVDRYCRLVEGRPTPLPWPAPKGGR